MEEWVNYYQYYYNYNYAVVVVAAAAFLVTLPESGLYMGEEAV